MTFHVEPRYTGTAPAGDILQRTGKGYRDLLSKALAGMLENLDEDITDFSKFKHVDLIETYASDIIRRDGEYTDYRLPHAIKYINKIVNNEMTVDAALTDYYSAIGYKEAAIDNEGNPILF
jgi:hypothetical protein